MAERLTHIRSYWSCRTDGIKKNISRLTGNSGGFSMLKNGVFQVGTSNWQYGLILKQTHFDGSKAKRKTRPVSHRER